MLMHMHDGGRRVALLVAAGELLHGGLATRNTNLFFEYISKNGKMF
jgi:hypothetical protein